MKTRKLTLTQAKARYPHRFTMEHKPKWAGKPMKHNGLYYAPQYRTDQEWYDNAIFPGEPGRGHAATSCISSNQSFPLGQALIEEFHCGQHPSA